MKARSVSEVCAKCQLQLIPPAERICSESRFPYCGRQLSSHCTWMVWPYPHSL